MPRGTHENSLNNLRRHRRPKYDVPKKVHWLTVTQTGWSNTKSLVHSMGMSVSELMEELGRGGVMIVNPYDLDIVDSAPSHQVIVERSSEGRSGEEAQADDHPSFEALNA
jgi:hypothetical protein